MAQKGVGPEFENELGLAAQESARAQTPANTGQKPDCKTKVLGKPKHSKTRRMSQQRRKATARAIGPRSGTRKREKGQTRAETTLRKNARQAKKSGGPLALAEQNGARNDSEPRGLGKARLMTLRLGRRTRTTRGRNRDRRPTDRLSTRPRRANGDGP